MSLKSADVPFWCTRRNARSCAILGHRLGGGECERDVGPVLAGPLPDQRVVLDRERFAWAQLDSSATEGPGTFTVSGPGQLQFDDRKQIKFSELQKKGTLTLNGIRTQVHGREAEQPIRNGEDYQAGPVVIAGKPFKETTPAQPNGAGEVHIDLAGLNANRLTVALGADYPQGQVTKYQRHTYSTRTKGKTARFLTVIEPFEKEGASMVRKVEALSASELKVVLADGTEQTISIEGLTSGREGSKVTLTESSGGRIRIKEEAISPISSTVAP